MFFGVGDSDGIAVAVIAVGVTVAIGIGDSCEAVCPVVSIFGNVAVLIFLLSDTISGFYDSVSKLHLF